MTASPEFHMVVIETEKTGRVELTPEQFDLLMGAALIGLEGHPEEDYVEDVDIVYEKVAQMIHKHR